MAKWSGVSPDHEWLHHVTFQSQCLFTDSIARIKTRFCRDAFWGMQQKRDKSDGTGGSSPMTEWNT